MSNEYFKFYGKNHISPVHQDLSDYSVHLRRRAKLYRQLGIPELTFQGREMLEVGPGSGYNTLAFFSWGVRHIDLVEANPQGIVDMKVLFKEYNIDENRYTIHETAVEAYETNKKYDLIIAESFLQHINNQKEGLFGGDGGSKMPSTPVNVLIMPIEVFG